MLNNICCYLLQLKTYIQNILRSILRKIYVTKSVTIIEDGKVISVYWRYIMMYFTMLFKFMMVDSLYKFFCKLFDVETDIVQLVKNIEYVDRYIIYENKEHKKDKHAIQHTIEYVNKNEDKIKEITLQKNIIIQCSLIDGEKKIDLKPIFAKYGNMNKNINNNTIKKIFLFNSIKPTDSANISVSGFYRGKIETKIIPVKNILDETINNIYNKN